MSVTPFSCPKGHGDMVAQGMASGSQSYLSSYYNFHLCMIEIIIPILTVFFCFWFGLSEIIYNKGLNTVSGTQYLLNEYLVSLCQTGYLTMIPSCIHSTSWAPFSLFVP